MIDVDALDRWTNDGTLKQRIGTPESGSWVDPLEQALACTFATSWGDGVFEVHRDLDVDGSLVSLRVDGNGVHLNEQLSAATVLKEAPLGVHRSEALTEALAPLAERHNGTDVTLTLTYLRKDNPNGEQKVTQDFHILPSVLRPNIV